MEIVRPEKLKPGDTIGIVAPSSWIDPGPLDKSVAVLKGLGFNVVVHPQCYLPTVGASAGTPEQKITALHEMFLDPEIDAVFCTKGGREAVQILSGIDYDIIKANPKIFIGFSDTTALLTAFAQQSGLISFHGPHLAYFSYADGSVSMQNMMRFLCGEWQGNLFGNAAGIEVLKEGNAEGKLAGGNFPLIVGLLLMEGKYIPPVDGGILVMEAVGKEISDIDQYLGAMKAAGIFDRVSGVVFGQFTDIKDTPNSLGRRFDLPLKEVLYRNTKGVKGPVIFNAPIGHEHPNITWPYGVTASLSAGQGKTELVLKESPFSNA